MARKDVDETRIVVTEMPELDVIIVVLAVPDTSSVLLQLKKRSRVSSWRRCS